MRIDSAYPSKYLKTADLQGRAVRVTIDRFEIEEIGDGDRKPCLYFEGKERGIVLNRTNADTITASLGEETDNWIGQVIELYPDKTRFAGKMVDCIRVRVPRRAAAATREIVPSRDQYAPPRTATPMPHGSSTDRDPPPIDDSDVPF